MFTSKGMELRDIGLWAGAQIAARMAEAREVNNGLRALFLPQHSRTPMVRLAQARVSIGEVRGGAGNR
jgi:hypothetical protein